MLHISFLAINVLYWISLYATATADPGYLPRNAPAYDEAIKQVLECVLLIFTVFFCYQLLYCRHVWIYM